MNKIYQKEDTILSRLQLIYSDQDAQKAFKCINELIDKYKDKIEFKSYQLSEKDVILITYANQVLKPNQKPLLSLNNFLDRYVKDFINSVHILPFYPYSSDDGFSVIEYKEVCPKIGSWQDIQNLSKNYRLMFDAVINHVSQSSSWFQKFLQNDPCYKEFFTQVDPSVDLSGVTRPRTLPLLHDYQDIDKKRRYIWTTFSKDQVDLNYANYKVLIAVLDVLLFYVQKGADLLRFDAIAFIWKIIGTPCVHLKQTHELIKLMREVIHKIAPWVIIVTETNVPHDENISYFGNGYDEAQMVYNFALSPLLAHSILKQNTKALTKWANSLSLPSDRVCFFNFSASHDGCGLRAVSDILSLQDIDDLIKNVKKNGGFVSYRSTSDGKELPYELNASYIDIISNKDEKQDLRVKKMILTQAVVLSMPGVAGIYFHSLVGSSNDLEGVKKTKEKRSINRQKLDYDTLTKELNQKGSIRAEIFNEYKRLLSIRKEQKAFHPFGEFKILSLHDKVFAIERKSIDKGESILAIYNFSNKSLNCKTPIEQNGAYDLIHQRAINTKNIDLEPYMIRWIKY